MIDVEVFPMVKERVPPNLREPQIKKLIKKWLVGQGLKEKDDFETEYCPIGSYALDRLDFCVFSEFGKIAIEVKGHVNGPHHRITSLLDQVMRYLRWIPWLIIVVHNGRMVGSIQRFIGDMEALWYLVSMEWYR